MAPIQTPTVVNQIGSIDLTNRYFRAIIDIQNAVDGCQSEDTVYEGTIAILGPASGASRAYVFLAESSGDRVLVTQVAEWCGQEVESQVNNPEVYSMPLCEFSPAWYSDLLRGKTVVQRRLDADGAVLMMMQSQDIFSLVLIPITYRGAFHGFIGFDNCTHDDPWPEESVNVLRICASIIGTSLERLIAHQTIAETESRFSKLIADLPVGVASISALGELLVSNAIADQYFQAMVPERDLAGPTTLLHILEIRLSKGLGSDTVIFNDWIVVGGALKYITTKCTPVTHGSQTQYSLVLSDSTEQREQLEFRMSQERNLRSVFEGLPMPVIVTKGLVVLDWNNAATVLWSLSLPKEQRELESGQGMRANDDSLFRGELSYFFSELVCLLFGASDPVYAAGIGLERWILPKVVDTNYRDEPASLYILEDVTEKIERKHQLELSETRFRRLVETSSDIFLHITESGQILYASPAVERNLGYTPSEVQDSGIALLSSPSAVLTLHTYAQAIIHGHVARDQVELELITRLGGPRWYSIRGAQIQSIAGETCALLVCSDINNRVLEEKSRKEQEALLHLITDAVDLPVVVLDIDLDSGYVVRFANTDAREKFRFAPAYQNGMKLNEILPPEDRQEWRQYLAKTLQTGSSVQWEHSVETSELTQWWQLNTYPIFGPDRKPLRIVIFGFDVTALKTAGQRLREQEALFSAVLNAVQEPLVVFSKNKEGAYRYVFANKTFFDASGMDIEQVEGKLSSGDPREEYLIFQAETLDEVLHQGHVRTIEQSTTCQGVTRAWITSLTPLVDPGGLGQLVISLSVDVSSLRASQAENSRQRTLLQSYFDAIQDPLFILERTGERTYRYTFVNKKTAELLARAETDIIGQTLSAISGKEKEVYIIELYERALAERRILSHEELNPNTRMPGYWLFRITPIYDDLDRPSRIMVIAFDITEQRQLAVQIEQQKELLSSVMNSMPSPISVMERYRDGRYRVLFVNRWLERMIGALAEEVMGQDIYRVFARSVVREHLPYYNQSIDTGELLQFEHCTIENSLETKWLTLINPIKGKAGEPDRLVSLGIDVTRLKSLEVRVLEQNQFLDAVIESLDAPVAVFEYHSDEHYSCVYMSSVGRRLMGLSEVDVTNQTVEHLFGVEFSREFYEQMTATFRRGVSSRVEARLPFLPQDKHWLVTNTPIYHHDGAWHRVVTMAIDITEKTKAEQKVQEDRILLDSVFNNVPNVLVVVDCLADGSFRFSYVNQAYERVSGISMAQVEGCLLNEVLDRELEVQWQGYLRACVEAGSVIGFEENDTIKRFDPLTGKQREDTISWEVRVCPIRNADGDIIRVAMVSVDITERKDAELRITEALLQIENANRELEQRVAERTEALNRSLLREKEINAIRETFMKTVSHQFRTPLSVITSSAEILKLTEQPSGVQLRTDLYKGIHRGVDIIVSLLDGISKLNELQISLARMTIGTVDLCRVLSDECQSHIYQGRRVQITQPSVPVFVLGDQEGIRQVARELIDNSVRHGGDVDVTIQILEEHEVVRIVFEDNGSGIPHADLARVFEPFYRSVANENSIGAGLGLAHARQIAEAMNGSLLAEASSTGARIVFELNRSH